MLSVCGGEWGSVFFFSLLSFLCIFFMFLLYLVGDQSQAATVNSGVAEGMGWGEVWWHPAQAGHLRVLSISNASAANGQEVVASAPRPCSGIYSSDDDNCDVAPRLIFQLQIVVVIYDTYISTELLFKGFSCITSNLLGFYNFFVAFFKRF